MNKKMLSSDRASLWSLADQGSVSLGNFLTNILLARTLAPSDYGIFALVYGLLVLLNSFHACAILYPLSIRGAASDIVGLHKYTRRSLLLTALLSFPFAIVVLGATELLGLPAVAPWAIVALWCWQTQETLRRSLMAHLRHGEAVWGDAFSYLGQASIIYLCLRSGYTSLELVFGIIATTSILAAALQALQLRLKIRGKSELIQYSRDSWNLSRWALLANAAVAVPNLAFPWLLALRGTQESASFQVLVNLAAAANPVIFSVSNVVVPATARAAQAGGMQAAWKVTWRYGIRGATLVLPFYLIAIAWPRFLLQLVYGSGSAYLAEGKALRLLIIGYSFVYASCLLAAFFYGLGQSKKVLVAQFAGSVCAIIAGYPLISRLGVVGASAGFTLVFIVQTIAFLLLFRRVRCGGIPLPQLAKTHNKGEKGIVDAAVTM